MTKSLHIALSSLLDIQTDLQIYALRIPKPLPRIKPPLQRLQPRQLTPKIHLMRHRPRQLRVYIIDIPRPPCLSNRTLHIRNRVIHAVDEGNDGGWEGRNVAGSPAVELEGDEGVPVPVRVGGKGEGVDLGVGSTVEVGYEEPGLEKSVKLKKLDWKNLTFGEFLPVVKM